MNDIEPGVAYLEHFPKAGGPARRVPLSSFPFTLGRADTATLRIDSTQVSREHAAIVRVQGELRIRDLGSTNGTFVNGQQIQEARLEHGDIIHVATLEFTYFSGQTTKGPPVVTQVVDPKEARAAQLGSPSSVTRAARRFQEMLVHRCVRVAMQPIVELEGDSVLGYAAFGGADHELGRSPADHFLLATETRLSDRLSQLARLVAVEQAAQLPSGSRVFLPLHPFEVGHDSLIASLCALELVLTGQQSLVVEVPESAVTGAEFIQPIRDRLADSGIALAYANFRSGKGRLMELADVPAEFLKLDKSLIQGVSQAKSRQKQVRDVIQACQDHDIRVIATGVDSKEDAEQCRDLGCHAAQGAWFGLPQPLSALATLEKPLVSAHD